MGGIGNQMFQYTAGLILARKHGVSLKMDTTFLEDKSWRYYRHTHRDYALDVFKITGSIASAGEISQFTVPRVGNKFIYHIKRRFFTAHDVFRENKISPADFMNIPANAYIDGYWQSASYVEMVKDQIRTEFTFADPLPEYCRGMLEQIRGTTSVCAVFRRGDFVKHPLLDVVDLSFYREAIRQMDASLNDYTVFVFSDDIDWCRNNFRLSEREVVFVDQSYTGPKAQYYLQLIMACRHFVIPNSTYAWWGAWLGGSEDKTVIAPTVWHKGQIDRRNKILPDDWNII